MINFELWWSSDCESQRNWWQQNIFCWYQSHLQHSLSLRWLFISFILIWKISDYIADYWCLWMAEKKKTVGRQNSNSNDILINSRVAACMKLSFWQNFMDDLCALTFKNCKHHNYFLSLQTGHNHHSHCHLRWHMKLWNHIWAWKKTDCKKTVF